jgi:hypothetical protein
VRAARLPFFTFVVIAGLDPAIPLVKRMDTRVKPAYDTFAVAFYFISDSRAA